jgi:glycosyltransferase involved in cell wall biosynthesis
VAVPIGDADALAGALMQLLDDESLRLRIASAAHERALAQDADYTAQHFKSLYSSLIGVRA